MFVYQIFIGDEILSNSIMDKLPIYCKSLLQVVCFFLKSGIIFLFSVLAP